MSFNNKKQIVKKPYCKVCHDAGKPEGEYTNHYVRSLPDRNGNSTVTCPTLLSIECRFCQKQGHTTKFCPTLIAKNKAEERNNRKETYKKSEEKKSTVTPSSKQKKPSTNFDVLIDSDSENEKPITKGGFVLTKGKKDSLLLTKDKAPAFIPDEYPELCSQKVKKEVMNGWASFTANIKTAIQQHEELGEKLMEKTKNQTEEEHVKKPSSMPKPIPAPMPIKKLTNSSSMNWADYTSDDDEYEEAEEYLELNFTEAVTEWEFAYP
jgi:hypothetical protein